MAADQAMSEIAQGATENKCESNSGGGHGVTVFPEQSGDDHQGDQREQDQDGYLPFRRGIGEKTEGGATIFHVGKTKEAWDDADAVVQQDGVLDGELG